MNYKRKQCKRHGKSGYYSEQWYGNNREMSYRHRDHLLLESGDDDLQDYFEKDPGPSEVEDE